MRIKLWNSFASNNSGSYTLVGEFDEDARARAVGDELRRVCDAHEKWLDEPDGRTRPASTSPLGQFVLDNELAAAVSEGSTMDDWPEHGSPPRVEVVGSRVVLHVDYTVTMPRCFGEFVYREGGRVAVELNHAHHPLIVRFMIWVAWDSPRQSEWKETIRPACVERLRAIPTKELWFGLEWSTLVVAAVFEDVMDGLLQVRRVVDDMDLGCRFSISEANRADGELLAGFGEQAKL